MKTENMSGVELRNGQFQVATVSSVNGGSGFAKYMKDYVKFNSEAGYTIVAGTQLPQFGPSDVLVDMPKVGESIVVIVEEVENGWVAIGWGHYTEFKTAQRLLAPKTECPKPAPATPQAMNTVKLTAAQVAKLRVGNRRCPTISHGGVTADVGMLPASSMVPAQQVGS